ncbi:hypothetical protein HY948_01265 [Candidatus Gottesmanbacteria bacterium]|nr:hypothetical protein [Candidatus Gottesmanbacteria bacterium]
MQEYFELLAMQAKTAALRIESASLRAQSAFLRWQADQKYEELAGALSESFGDTDVADIGAIHYVCTPPKDSGVASRRHTDSLGSPDASLSREDLLRTKEELVDFNAYLDALPSGSIISLTITDKHNRVLGSVDRIKE